MSSDPGGKGRGRGRKIVTGGGDAQTPGSPTSSVSSETTPSSTRSAGRGRGRPVRPGGDNSPPGDVGAATASMGGLTLARAITASGEGTEEFTKVRNAPSQEGQKLEQAMKRPGVGKEGRPIQLFANHFPLQIPPNMLVYHYDLAMARRYKRSKDKPKSTKPKKLRPRADDDEGSGMREEIIGREIINGEEFEIVLCRRNRWPKWLAMEVYKKLVGDQAFGLHEYRFKMAFDGARNVFAQCALPVPNGDGYVVEIKIPDEQRNETFLVNLNHVAQVNIDLRDVFNRNLIERRSTTTLILDIILRQSKMFNNVFISMGSRAFYRPTQPSDLGGGIWRYPGIWESVRPISGWKSTINLDLANTAFVKSGPLLSILDDFLRNSRNRNWQNRRLDPPEMRQLEKVVKNLKVTSHHRHGPRTGRCIGLSKLSARDLTFDCPRTDGSMGQLSVETYFKMMHEKKEFVRPVQYPLLPCLQIGNKAKANYIPLEFCEIKEGQRFNHKLSDKQTSEMLKVASQSAPERKRRIEEEARENFKLGEDPYLKSFGLNVDLNMTRLQGRVLKPPTIEYDQKATVPPRDGGWNMRDVRVIKGARIRNYAVINTDPNTSKANMGTFCYGLVDEARKLGITFESKEPIPGGVGDVAQAEEIQNILQKLKQMAIDPNTNESTLDLVFVILSTKNSLFYSAAKSAGDVVLGINTQCVLGKNVQKANGSLLANLLLKINAKMGGINNKLLDGSKAQVQQLREPILIIGADVNHPAPTDVESSPSVAAVVANMDPMPAQYLAKIMVQGRRQEPIAELQTAVADMLYNFFIANGRVLPMRIIMYRDGVGESMFLKVLTDELYAIRRACETMEKYLNLDKEYKPPITFIVVQKRHHTRLFCANKQDETGRGQNIPPGTIVDTTIVHPEEFDFYLCSHLGLQGTSRPTHYHVLWDDSNFTADELEMLTYYLCYTYVRATKSVSIPPPVYYADLVAYRARQYLTWSWQNMSETASSGSNGSTVSLSELQKYVAVKENIANKGMYFV